MDIASYYADLTHNYLHYAGDTNGWHFGVWENDVDSVEQSLLRSNEMLFRGLHIDHQTRVFGLRLFPTLTEADAQARLLATLPASYALITNIAASAADLVRQNTLINTLRRAFRVRASEVGADVIANPKPVEAAPLPDISDLTVEDR